MAELIFNNYADTFARGYGQGANMREDKKRQKDEAELRALAPAIVQGDLAAYGQAAAIDPAAAQQYQQSGDVTFKRLAGAYKLVDDARKVGDIRAVNAALRQTAPFFSQVLGKPVPTEWAEGDQAWEDGWGKLGQQIAMAQTGSGAQGNVQSTYIDEAGNRVAIMRDGTTQVLGKNAPNNQIIDTGNGFVGVNKGNLQAAPVVLGGQPATNAPAASGSNPAQEAILSAANVMIQRGVPEAEVDAWVQQQLSQPVTTQAAPTGQQLRSTPNAVQQQQLSIAQQANQRAAEASQRAEQAAANAQRGNAPTGFRFKADGSLEPIPGGPKPAGAAATEGERKAATLLTRLTGSLSQLEQAVKEDPDAASPNLLAAGAGAILGETVGNKLTPATRQRVEAAQLDILDAALTLGTGAAYTKEQLEGYRKSYFPQIGDSEGTIKDKAARLNNVIQAAKIAAGRAAPAPNPDDDLVNKYLD